MRIYRILLLAAIIPVGWMVSCSTGSASPGQIETAAVTSKATTYPGISTTVLPPAKSQPGGINEVYIESVLSHSTEIDDPAHDWISTGNVGDNPGAYPAGIVDIQKMLIGMDRNYLYIKIIFNGVLPKRLEDFPSFAGDPLQRIGYNVGLDIDNNGRTGSISDGGTEAMVGYGIKNENGHLMMYSQYFTGPTGTEVPEGARYHNQVFGVQLQFGGEGSDYHIIAIPIAPLGITRGQELTINAWAEGGSSRYEHASFDVLCPASLVDKNRPMVCPIKFKVGEEYIIK